MSISSRRSSASDGAGTEQAVDERSRLPRRFTAVRALEHLARSRSAGNWHPAPLARNFILVLRALSELKYGLDLDRHVRRERASTGRDACVNSSATSSRSEIASASPSSTPTSALHGGSHRSRTSPTWPANHTAGSTRAISSRSVEATPWACSAAAATSGTRALVPVLFATAGTG